MEAADGSAGVLTLAGEGETITNPLGRPLRFLAGAEETGGSLTILESTPAGGEGPPFHVHAEQDEVVYVLEGEFRFRLEDEVSAAPPGSMMFIRRGTQHSWQNTGSEPGRLLVAFVPGAPGMERFFREFARLPEGKPVGEGFRELGPEAGMDVVGPPLAQTHPL
jgi:quercetin dioxygenase-like cupin family protein